MDLSKFCTENGSDPYPLAAVNRSSYHLQTRTTNLHSPHLTSYLFLSQNSPHPVYVFCRSVLYCTYSVRLFCTEFHLTGSFYGALWFVLKGGACNNFVIWLAAEGCNWSTPFCDTQCHHAEAARNISSLLHLFPRRVVTEHLYWNCKLFSDQDFYRPIWPKNCSSTDNESACNEACLPNTQAFNAYRGSRDITILIFFYLGEIRPWVISFTPR